MTFTQPRLIIIIVMYTFLYTQEYTSSPERNNFTASVVCSYYRLIGSVLYTTISMNKSMGFEIFSNLSKLYTRTLVKQEFL